MRKTLPLVLATMIALAFMVAPSLSRLAFLVDLPPARDPTDLAFAEHRTTGLLHVIPGLVMLALMPVQASASLRRRWPAAHRALGRIFVAMGVLVSLTAVVMNLSFPVVGGLLKVTVIYAMGLAEVTALALGVWAIRRRDVAAHRRWMVRAMGIGLSGGTAGLFVVPFYAAGSLTDLVVGAGRWLGFLTTVVAVEMWLSTSDDGLRRASGQRAEGREPRIVERPC